MQIHAPEFFQGLFEQGMRVSHALVFDPQSDDAVMIFTGQVADIGKVAIIRQNDSLFLLGLLKDVRVRSGF